LILVRIKVLENKFVGSWSIDSLDMEVLEGGDEVTISTNIN